MNTANKIKGAGRGRTKGSFSFITVSAETLNGFPNVVVSRKWAEAVGIADNLVAKNSLETFKKASIAETETTKVQVSIEE